MLAKFCLQCGAPLETRELDDATRTMCSESCGFIFYENPTPVVAAIVEHEGDVILVQNKGWPESWYGLVSGFLERDEDPSAAILRELKEELGLDGSVTELIGVYGFTQRNELIVAYHIDASGELTVGDELVGYKRIPPHKLKPWPFGTGDAVRDWLARRAENPGD